MGYQWQLIGLSLCLSLLSTSCVRLQNSHQESSGALRIDPDRFVYIAGYGSQEVRVVGIDTKAGLMSSIESHEANAQVFRLGQIKGQYLYAALSHIDSIMSFKILSDGKLSKTGSRISVGTPNNFLYHESTEKLHVSHFDAQPSGSIVTYNVNPADGTLTLSQTLTQDIAGPIHMDFSPDGNRLYVVNQAGNTVTSFNLDSDGNLSRTTTPPQIVGATPTHFVMNSSNTVAYFTSISGTFSGISMVDYDSNSLFNFNLADPSRRIVWPNALPIHIQKHPDSNIPFFYVSGTATDRLYILEPNPLNTRDVRERAGSPIVLPSFGFDEFKPMKVEFLSNELMLVLDGTPSGHLALFKINPQNPTEIQLLHSIQAGIQLTDVLVVKKNNVLNPI